MEAHNGLSAKLAAEAGFEALWGSGLSISAALGVRDNNEASWTQVLEVLEFMADATDLPILLDGDTGYGNFNNVRRLVAQARAARHRRRLPRGQAVPQDQQLHRRRAPGAGRGRRVLRQAARRARTPSSIPDFVVVARTEAFIAGWGLDETLLRATAYAEAGADVILVHSKRKDSNEIMAFMKHWDRPRAGRHRADQVPDRADRQASSRRRRPTSSSPTTACAR